MKKTLKVDGSKRKARYLNPNIPRLPERFEKGTLWVNSQTGSRCIFKEYDEEGMEVWEFVSTMSS